MGSNFCVSDRNNSLFVENLRPPSAMTEAEQIVDNSNYKGVQRDFKIGIYMDLKKSKKVPKLWKQMIKLAKSMNQNEDHEELDNEMKLLKNRYKFLVSKQDCMITQLWMLDKKGFNFLISLGPPAELRWASWKVILLMNCPKDFNYEGQLSINENNSNITADIARTLITHDFFKKVQERSLGQLQLTRVLHAISNAIKNLGYCQGMNFLAGFILMVSGCDEKLTFNSFITLLLNVKYLLIFCYVPNLPLAQMISYFVRTKMEQQMPELFDHLKTSEIPESFWLSKMIFSLFLYVFPIETCLRFWDYIITRGIIGLAELILSVMDGLKDDILSFEMEQIAMMFQGQLLAKNQQRQLQKEINIELCIYHAKTKYHIRKKEVVKLTRSYLQEIVQKKHRNIQFEIIFLDFENQEIFQAKMEKFIKESYLS